MSNVERVENLNQLVGLVEPDFNRLAAIHGAVSFARESSFALQILRGNSFLTSVALGDQDSLKQAILNVAAIGLSLSPVYKLAYLVPRDGKVCLDISYLGFVQLATDVGAIKWAIAEVVHKNDKFALRGFGKEPLHEFEPFGDRGEIVGAYCVAKTHDGEFLTTQMTNAEIWSIRDRSPSWKSFEKDQKSTPWKTDTNEMIKKTVIRRAWKSWPKTDSRKRFEQAVDVTSDFDPSESVQISGQVAPDAKAESLANIRRLLVTLNRTEAAYLLHLGRTCQREIKQLEDLTSLEISQATTMLTALTANQVAKVAKETA